MNSAEIGTLRLLSNGASLGLLDPCGEITWWCAPEPHSRPLLWRLLGSNGSAAAWVGCEPRCAPGEIAGPALHTLVVTQSGRVELWDALLTDDAGAPLLVRLVRAADRQLVMEHTLALGGFEGPVVRWDKGPSALVNGLRLHVHGGMSIVEGASLRTTLTAERGTWAALTVGANRSPGSTDSLLRRVEQAVRGQEAALARALPPRHNPRRARDALAVLRACTFGATGAVVAASTTSLPEAVGGTRQFDYRYSWLRDAAAGVAVAALLGELEQAESYLRFVEHTSRGMHLPLIVSDVHGRRVPDERDVTGINGWRGSQPVRVGNAAGGQVQHDAIGLFIEAVSVFAQQGGRLLPSTWGLTCRLADALCAEPGASNGIWEFRAPRALVSADIGRWLGIDRAIWISRGWHPLADRRRWLLARARVRKRVLGAVSSDGGLPQAYGDTTAVRDAAALLIPMFGLLRAKDPRASRLIDATLADLDAWPFVYRYPPSEEDGFVGMEGTFTVAAWWAVAALAAVGRYREARERADELDRRLPRLLAEEVAPASGESLGNTPLVWAHMEAARANYLLDAADLRRRFTVVGLSAWRVGRFISLRTRSHLRRT